jgi:hypothetical protein
MEVSRKQEPIPKHVVFYVVEVKEFRTKDLYLNDI